MNSDRNNIDKSMETILNFFFKHQIELKLYHFQSNSYGGHKASDKYLTGFLVKFDLFMEVLQGYAGKVCLQQLTVQAGTSNDQTIFDILKNYTNKLQVFETEFERYSDLQNIIHEMKADAAQLLYLLTFK